MKQLQRNEEEIEEEGRDDNTIQRTFAVETNNHAEAQANDTKSQCCIESHHREQTEERRIVMHCEGSPRGKQEHVEYLLKERKKKNHESNKKQKKKKKHEWRNEEKQNN